MSIDCTLDILTVLQCCALVIVGVTQTPHAVFSIVVRSVGVGGEYQLDYL